MPTVRKNPSPTKSTGGLPAVTPIEVDRVRRSVLDVVRNNIPKVRGVLDGTVKWDNQQVRVFGMMLNKVMPDLHHSFNEHTVETKKVDQLSIQELEEIAARADEQEKSVVDLEEQGEKADGEEESKWSVQREEPKQAI
jgi:hypothetical protein